MESVAFVLKIIVSVMLGMASFFCLLRGFYLWFKLWRRWGESHRDISLVIARLNFLAGAVVSLIAFLWNPKILLLLILLCFSLVWALLVYQSVASPYQLASWWHRLAKSRKSENKEKT